MKLNKPIFKAADVIKSKLSPMSSFEKKNSTVKLLFISADTIKNHFPILKIDTSHVSNLMTSQSLSFVERHLWSKLKLRQCLSTSSCATNPSIPRDKLHDSSKLRDKLCDGLAAATYLFKFNTGKPQRLVKSGKNTSLTSFWCLYC